MMFTRVLDRLSDSILVQKIMHYSGVVTTLCAIGCVFYINAYFSCPQLYNTEQCQIPVYFGYWMLLEVALNLILFNWHRKLNHVTSLIPNYDENFNKKFLTANQRSALPITVDPRSISMQQNPEALKFRQSNSQQNSADFDDNSPNSAEKSAKFCDTCQLIVPQRSHHCPLCGYCVLKKDHHCYFTGGCVGYGNQRYFMVFLFWAAVGGAYGTLYAARYLNTFYRPMFPFGWIDYIFPLAIKKFIFFQHCSLIQLAMVFVFTIGASGSGAAMLFFVLQWYLIFKNKTFYEYTKRSLKHHQFRDGTNFSQRIEMVFGRYWFVNFLVPLPFRNKLDEGFKKLIYDYYVKEL